MRDVPGLLTLDHAAKVKYRNQLAALAIRLDEAELFMLMEELGFGHAALRQNAQQVVMHMTDLQLVALVAAFRAYVVDKVTRPMEVEVIPD